MFDESPTGFNIKTTFITDDIRVSTGVYIGDHMYGFYGQVETFIFHPEGQYSPMKIHGTYSLNRDSDAKAELPERLRDRAIKSHNRYVRFYQRRYAAWRVGGKP